MKTQLSQKNNQRKRCKRDFFQQKDRSCTTINLDQNLIKKEHILKILEQFEKCDLSHSSKIN